MRLIDADALQYSDARDMLPTGQYITREEIDSLPTVDAEPIRHGHWIHWIFNPKDEMMFTLPKCSECGAESPNGGNYCPYCGAKMDEEEQT